jgi:hypothetical protein
MKQYIISISDERKANQLLDFLSDLSYVKIINSPKQKENAEFKRFPLMNNPFPVEDFKKFNREELYER